MADPERRTIAEHGEMSIEAIYDHEARTRTVEIRNGTESLSLDAADFYARVANALSIREREPLEMSGVAEEVSRATEDALAAAGLKR